MKIRYCIIALFLGVILASCDMMAPPIPDSGTIPFQRPATPTSVKTENGFADKIILTWDSVDNATGYIVYGARMSEIGEGLKPIGVVRSNTPTYTFSSTSIDIDRNQSYVFSVVAMTEYGGSENTTLYSDFSQRVEGAFAPSSINLHVITTDTTINAYWASPNLFSSYNNTHNSIELYNAKFTLSYWKEGSNDVVTMENDSADRYLYESISINNARLEQGETYIFHVNMEITHSDGSFDTVQSSNVSVVVNSNMKPDIIQKDDIAVTQGDNSEGITVSWVVPSYIYPLNRDNTYFKIERKAASGGDWQTLVDEFEEKSYLITASDESGNLIMTYVDKEVEPFKEYVYRIKNGVSDSRNVIYTHDAEGEESEYAFLYSPTVESLVASWVPSEDKVTAEVDFAYTPEITPVDGVALMIEKDVYHMLTDKHTYEYIDFPSSAYTENNPSDCGENAYHEFSYSLVLVKNIETKDIYANLGKFTFEEGESNPSLGQINLDNLPLFSDLSASTDRVGKIVISWTERTYDVGDITLPYTYSYSLDNEYWIPVDSITDSSFEIQVDRETTVYLKASSNGNEYISPVSVTGKPLTVSDVTASDSESGSEIILRWDSSDMHESVSYSVEKSIDDTFSQSESISVDYRIGEYRLDLSSLPVDEREQIYYFRLKANNIDYVEEGEVYSKNSDSGTIFKSVRGITATKGSYIGEVQITWNKVSDAERYDVYRYNSEISEYDFVGSIEGAENTLLKDTAPDRNKPYYAVAAVKGDIESLYSATTETVQNNLKEIEAANIGYSFDETEITDVNVISGIDENSYVLPYFTVTFKATTSANKYIIYAESEKTAPAFTFDMADLQASSDESIYTNGKADTEVGYVSYNRLTHTVTANVMIGIVDSKELAVTIVNVVGINDTVSDNNSPRTNENRKAGTFRRALTIYDYIYLYNIGLNEVVAAADKTFSGDWYGRTTGSLGDNKAREYKVGDTVYIVSCSSDFWLDNQYRGSITLTNYLPSSCPIKITTLNKIMLLHRNGGDAGYLDIDPLDSLNPDSNDNNSTTLTITGSYSIGGQMALYRDASISVTNLKVDGSGGSYAVSITGGSSDSVTIPHAYVQNKVL